jgi:hypothetical protein
MALISLKFGALTIANPTTGEGYEVKSQTVGSISIKEINIPFTNGKKIMFTGTNQENNLKISIDFFKFFTTVKDALDYQDTMNNIISDPRNCVNTLTIGDVTAKSYTNMLWKSATINETRLIAPGNGYACVATGSLEFEKVVS